MDRRKFFAAVRLNPFGGRLTADQVRGMEDVLDAWPEHGDDDDRKLAYVFASVFQETGRRMVPVRETFASSDAQAAARLENAFRAGKLKWVKTPYWRADSDGNHWLGRGRVQNTHKRNYAALERRLGYPFTKKPNLLLESKIDAIVTIVGHMEGIWTTHKLADFFNRRVTDWHNARRIVNPGEKDSYAKVGDYGKDFHSAIVRAGGVPADRATEKPAGEQEPSEPTTDTPKTNRALVALVGAALAAVLALAAYVGIDITEHLPTN